MTTFIKKFRSALPETIFLGLLLIVFLIIGTKLLPGPYNFSRALILFDEGTLLTGAKRLIHGEIPYRDFWTIYPPLNFITLGAAFQVFGENIYVERFFHLIISLTGLASIYWLLRSKTNYFFAGIVCLMFVFFGSPIKLTHLLIFMTLVTLFALMKNKNSRFLPYLCGLVGGLFFAARLDFGIVAGFIFFITTFFLEPKNYKKILHLNLKFLSGFLIITLPLFIWLAANQALIPFFEQTILYPFFGNYSTQRSLPIPSFTDPWQGYAGTASFIFNWTFWIFTTITLSGIAFFKKTSRAQLLICLLFFVGSLPYLFQRSDIPHLAFINILGLAFFYYALFSIPGFRLKHFLITLIIPALLLYHPFKIQLTTREELKTQQQTIYSFYSKPLTENEDNNNLQKTLDYLTTNVNKSEPVYVGLKDHRKIFINNIVLYFLMPNPIPTKFHELHPGVANTAEIQTEIINEIKNVNYLVLWDVFYCEPNDSCNSATDNSLNFYIDENFSVTATFGLYTIWKRNASAL